MRVPVQLGPRVAKGERERTPLAGCEDAGPGPVGGGLVEVGSDRGREGRSGPVDRIRYGRHTVSLTRVADAITATVARQMPPEDATPRIAAC